MYIYCIYVRKTCICTYICICMKEALGIRFDKGWTTLIACRESERLLPFWIWSMPFTFQTSAREQTWNDWEALQVKLLSFFQNLLKLAMKEKHFHTEFCVCQAKKKYERYEMLDSHFTDLMHVQVSLVFGGYFFLNHFTCSTFPPLDMKQVQLPCCAEGRGGTKHSKIFPSK